MTCISSCLSFSSCAVQSGSEGGAELSSASFFLACRVRSAPRSTPIASRPYCPVQPDCDSLDARQTSACSTSSCSHRYCRRSPRDYHRTSHPTCPGPLAAEGRGTPLNQKAVIAEEQIANGSDHAPWQEVVACYPPHQEEAVDVRYSVVLPFPPWPDPARAAGPSSSRSGWTPQSRPTWLKWWDGQVRRKSVPDPSSGIYDGANGGEGGSRSRLLESQIWASQVEET